MAQPHGAGGAQDLGTLCSGLYSSGPCWAGARLPQLRGRASVQHSLSSHPVGPEIMSQRLFAPILHPGRALAHQGTAHPAVVSAARSSAQHDPCHMGPGRGRGAPGQLPPRIPLMKPLHGIFFSLGKCWSSCRKPRLPPWPLCRCWQEPCLEPYIIDGRYLMIYCPNTSPWQQCSNNVLF